MKSIHDTWVELLRLSRFEAFVVPYRRSVAGQGSGRLYRVLSFLLCLVALSLLTVSSVTAQIINQKLNGAFLGISGNVSDYAISADSSRVVYWADQDTDWQTELYASWEGSAVVDWMDY